MQGHIYRRRKPDGTWSRWHAVIDLPIDRTGRRRQKTSTHDTKRDAQAWLAKITQELRAGEVYGTKLTVGEFLTGWLEGRQSLRPSTRHAYQSHLAQHLIPELGHLRLQDLRSHHIEEMYRRITAANTGRERPVGPTTMRRLHATLNSALNTAVRRGLIRRNPATTVDLPRPSPVASSAWTSEEVATFLTAIEDDPLAVLYRLLVLAGLRRGEAVGVRWSDLDLPGGTLTVHRQVVSVAGELIVAPPKSEAGRRTVALDEVTVELLRLRQRRDRIDHWASTDQDFDDTPVFRRSDGKGVQPSTSRGTSPPWSAAMGVCLAVARLGHGDAGDSSWARVRSAYSSGRRSVRTWFEALIVLVRASCRLTLAVRSCSRSAATGPERG